MGAHHDMNEIKSADKDIEQRAAETEGVYHDVNGVRFTDEDIEQWAAEAEPKRGYTGKHLGRSVPGRPTGVGERAHSFTLRLDAACRAKLDEVAKKRHITVSQLMRDLIDSL